MLASVRKHHLVKQIGSMAYMFDIEQQVSDIQRNVAANRRVIDNVAHRTLPNPVKVNSDKVAVCVNDRAA